MAIADTGLVLRLSLAGRFIPRDSIVYLEVRQGKDRAEIAQIAALTAILGLVAGEQLGRRNRNDLGGALGSTYGGLIGAGVGTVVGTGVGFYVTPHRWNAIDVGFAFLR
ncbi:MAG: hypothetical protein ABI442_11425 [Gemmatimonadaceae bacterium]